MNEYSDRFPFLVRLEDYQKGNTMGSYLKNTKGYSMQSNTSNMNNNQTNALGGYGNGTNQNNNIGGFNNSNNNNGFGQSNGMNQNSSFGGFGQNNNNNGGGFGGFGQNNNTNNNGGGFGGFGQNNNNTGGGFGQNKPATGGFGGFGQNNNKNNNNTGGGFGGFGQNKPATGGFGGFGQNNNNNNNTGGSFGGFGQNNNNNNNNTGGGFGGFGQNNNNKPATGGFGSFGGFGQSNNNNGGGFGSFGQNNNNNGGQTTLTSTNGLMAGGFNVVTNKVKENPYNHLQKVTSKISTTSSLLSCQVSPSEQSPLQAPSSQISSCNHSFISTERLVATSSTQSESISPDLSTCCPPVTSKPFHIGVRYEKKVRVFSIQSTDTLSHFAQQVQNVLGLSHPPRFSYCNRLLSHDVSLSHCVPDGSVVTAFISPEEPKPTPQPSYTNHPPKLTKAHYTITPSIEELSKRMNFELTQVPNVVIEHPGIGKIEWQEPINLLGLDLDEVIEIEKNEAGSGYISVYENIDSESPAYPPVGTGINHPAVLTFYGVFPASGRVPEEFLKEKTKEIGGEFISYDEYTGNWSFKVPHFTRYGFDIDDEKEFLVDNETPVQKEIKNTELKRVHFDSVSDLFYISKQRRVFQHTSIPTPPPQLPLQSCVPVHVTCPSSRSAILSVLQQTSFPVSRKQTQSSGASFPVLFRGNTVYSVNDYSSISESSFFTTSSAGELDDCLEILRSFTVYVEEDPSAIPHIQICQNNLNSFLNQLLSYYCQANPGSQYKHLLVLLLQVLFVSEQDGRNGYVWKENEFSFDELTQEQQQLVFQKRRLFSRWLEEATKSLLWKDGVEMNSNSAFNEAIKYLLVHDINNACVCLKDAGYERLALQISQISMYL